MPPAGNGKGEYPSGQRGQTVNLLTYVFGGSNPSSPISSTPTARREVHPAGRSENLRTSQPPSKPRPLPPGRSIRLPKFCPTRAQSASSSVGQCFAWNRLISSR